MNYNTSTITEERSSQIQNEDLSNSSVLLTGAEYDRFHHYKATTSNPTRRQEPDQHKQASSAWKYKRYASLSSQREQQENEYNNAQRSDSNDASIR